MAELKPLEAAATSVAELPLRRLGRPVGRDALLRALLLRLLDKEQLVLHGAAGSGKTTVAATIANVYLQQRQQPALWLPIDNPPLVELVVRVARAYGDVDAANADNPLTQAGKVRALLQEHQPLLALDGEIEAGTLARFVARCAADVPLVATSTVPLAQGDWRNQPIGKLSEGDAAHLFKQKAGIKNGEADAAIRGLAAQLDFTAYPLALAARSMIIARQSPEEFADAIAESLERAGDDPFQAAIHISFEGLNERLRDLLFFLSATFRGEASVTFLNILSGIAVESIDMSMTILSRLFLVERFQRAGETCYRLHPSARRFLVDWSIERDRFDGLRADIFETTRDYLDVQGKADDALLRMMIEMDNLIAAAEAGAEADDPDLAADIAAALEPLADSLADQGYQYELRLLRGIRDGEPLVFAEPGEVESPADSESESPAETAHSVEPPPFADAEETGMARADDAAPSPPSRSEDDFALDEGDLEAVNIDQLRTALAVASQNAETARQLQILKAIARMQISQSREREAIATYGEVLAIYEKDSDADGALETLDMIAGLLVGGVGAPAALEELDLGGALSLARVHDDAPRAINVLEAVGKAQISQGRESDAVATFNEVLAIHERAEDKAGVLAALDMLAGLLVRSDSSVTALDHVQRALHLAHELDDYEAEMFLHITSGDARRALGEPTLAIEAYEKALRIARNREDMQNEAFVLYKLGMAQLDAGDSRQAIAMLEEANDRFKQQEKRDMEGQVLRGLGAVHVALERWSEAVNFHTSALYIAREVNDRATEAAQLRHLGQILIKAERLPEALTRLRQALHVAYEAQDKEAISGIIAELVSLMMRNLFLSSIAQLLITDGLSYVPDDRELIRLQGEVASAKERAAARGIALAVVAGTAREYAANAYNYN